jgi:hypothetical protein
MRLKFGFLFVVFVSFLSAKPRLSEYKEDVYSQWGEDGIVTKIFEVIGTSSKIAVEFGAADGFAFSNTANLWTKDPSWRAYLIENNLISYKNLTVNVAPYPCIPICRTVGISSTDSLEAILREYNVEPSIDILSIDVDGNESYIFETLGGLRPRVIICEYNPTLPAHLDIYAQYDNYMGCSVAALQRIAAQKGYSLIAITDTNCFFVLTEEFHLFSDYETDLQRICINKYIRYLVTDYAGNYCIIGEKDFLDPYGVNRPSAQLLQGEILVLPPIQ